MQGGKKYEVYSYKVVDLLNNCYRDRIVTEFIPPIIVDNLEAFRKDFCKQIGLVQGYDKELKKQTGNTIDLFYTEL